MRSNRIDPSRRPVTRDVRRAGGRITMSSDERNEARLLAQKRQRERAEQFFAPRAPRRAVITSAGIDWRAIPTVARELLRDILAKLSVSRESLVRSLIIGAMMIVFALVQTTLFTRLPPFGAVPDLMLSFVIAIAVTEGEHWGAIVSLFAAVVIGSLGAVAFDPSPILYLVCAYTAGVLSRYYLKQNALSRSLYTVAAGLLRAVATLIALAIAAPTFDVAAIRFTVIPEFFSTAVCAPIIHLIAWASLRPFHRSRAERTGSM